MTNVPNDELDEILTQLENLVAMDTSRRITGSRQSESPKVSHQRAKQAITDYATRQRINELKKLWNENQHIIKPLNAPDLAIPPEAVKNRISKLEATLTDKGEEVDE